jgi:membrane protein implicated in regulation of membrane protease activity
MRNKRAGFVSVDVVNVYILVIALSVLSILLFGGWVERVVVVGAVAAFVAFSYWFAWHITLRPGDRVRVTRGPHQGRRGVVDAAHNPQHAGRVRVVFEDGGAAAELSQYDVEKI